MAPQSTRRPIPATDPFKLLHGAHFAFVVHRAWLNGVPARYCQDVAQEVFATLHREMQGGLDASAPLKGWLIQTTFWRATDWKRLAHNREQPARAAAIGTIGGGLGPETIMDSEQTPAHAGLGIVDEAPDPEETAHAEQMAVHVQVVMDELPDDLRIVLMLHQVEEMPVSAIATMLTIPEGTVKTRLRTAKRRAREIWKEKIGTATPAVLPFALWDFADLLRTQRAVPPAPPGAEAAAWSRLAATLASGIGGAVAGAGAGAAAGKLAALLAGKKVVLATIAGLGIVGAVAAWWPKGHDVPEVPTVTAHSEPIVARMPAPAGSASAIVATAGAPVPALPVPTAPTSGTATVTGAPARNTDADDRVSLDNARSALRRHDPAAARAALARVKGQRFAEEREELRRVIQTYSADGGP